jgi:hypothetical protein
VLKNQTKIEKSDELTTEEWDIETCMLELKKRNSK